MSDTETKAWPTPGGWMPGHLIDDDHSCDCQYILSEGYMGAIATVHVRDDKPVSEGGNDHPPEHEARKNMRLIAAAGTEAWKVRELGYDPIKAQKLLPMFLKAFEEGHEGQLAFSPELADLLYEAKRDDVGD